MNEIVPSWIRQLDEEDLGFLKRFVFASGSLKALAKVYGVSYPTIRLRLDRLIQKIEIIESQEVESEFERKLRILLAEGKLAPNVMTDILRAYRRERREP